MPKLDSPIAACVTLLILASLAFALSFREGAAAPVTDQREPALAIVATATAAPPPTATTVAIASPSATSATAPTATTPASSPPPPPTTAVVATEGLNLREGPGPDFPVITVLGQGDILALTGAQHLTGTYRWVEVIAADGQQGWVFGEPIGMP